MLVTLQNRYTLALQHWSRVAAVATIIVGLVVLVGWWLNIGVLESILPGQASMKPNTALAFLVAGLALWLLQNKQTDSRLVLLRRACAGFLIVLGLLTLGEYIFTLDLGIDQLLARDVALP